MFKDQLKKAMQDLNINQSKLSLLTGIGKSSISQYLSGKNEPTDTRKRGMAVAIGLKEDYFAGSSKLEIPLGTASIERMLPEEAAKLMGVSKETVRKGLQDERFPWGYAIQTSEDKWTYFINARKFAEIERIVIG